MVTKIQNHPAFAELRVRYEWDDPNEAFPAKLANGELNPLFGVTGLMVKDPDTESPHCGEYRQLIQNTIDTHEVDEWLKKAPLVKDVISQFAPNLRLIPVERHEEFLKKLKAVL